MTPEEQKYIDQKFSEMENKFLNPTPEDVLKRAKKYRGLYYSFYKKFIPAVLIIMLATMFITFRWLGLF